MICKLLLIVALFIAESDIGHRAYKGPKCLGTFCVNNTVTAPQLLRRLGARTSNGSSPFCLEDKSDRIFVRINTIHETPEKVGDVLVSDFPNCFGESKANAKPRDWKTTEGIGLGSREEQVWSAYGKPESEDHVTSRTYSLLTLEHGAKSGHRDIGEKCLFYNGIRDADENDWASAQFGIRSGKVSWILLSVNE